MQRLLATMASGLLAWWITDYSLTRVDIWGADWLLSFTLLSVIFTAFAVGGVANTININALIDKGLVKVHNFSQSKNKFGSIYVLTPQGIAEKALLAGRFLKRKMQEYETLRAEIEALQSDMEKPVSL